MVRDRPLLGVSVTRSRSITSVEGFQCDGSLAKVDLRPAQGEQLASTSTGVCREMEEGVEPMRPDGRQEDPQVRHCPDLPGRGRLESRDLGPQRRVVRDQPIVLNGIVERLAKSSMNLTDRSWR